MAARRIVARLLAGLTCLLLTAMPCRGQEATDERVLLLEVSINGRPIEMIGHFRDRGGALFADAAQLRTLGLAVDDSDPEALLPLSAVPGLTVAVDERRQAIDFVVGDAGLVARGLSLRPRVEPVTAEAGWGGVFSYDLLGDYFRSAGSASSRLAGAGELRLFAPFATATTSMLGSVDADGAAEAIRLESRITVDRPESTVSFRLGDVVTGGLAWTRPVRAGALQVATNFALRPDIVTFPTPEVSGSAAAAATLDLFVNNVQQASLPVEAGPFEIDGLPVISGAGEVSLVLRDVLGREVVTVLPFYASTTLLDAGLMQFSAEAGLARENFGTTSGDYADPFLSGTIRRGMTKTATLEAHAEADADVANGGIGAVVALAPVGLVRGAVAVSGGAEGTGALASLGYERQGGMFSVLADVSYASGAYADISSTADSDFPRLTSLVSAGVSPPGLGSFSAAYTRIDGGLLGDSQIVSTSYSSPALWSGVQVAVTGFRNIEDGAFGAGLSLFVPLGERLFGSAGVQASTQGVTGRADLVSAAPVDDGFGWRVSLSQGAFTQREAQVVWDNRTVDLLAAATQGDAGHGARLGAVGSVAVLDGGPWFSDRIEDGFAVVRVGDFEGVEVLRENRPVGRTDSSGRLFVNDLRAYEPNNLSINPLDLPVDASIPVTRLTVAPRAGAGRVVRFDADQSRSALLTITLPAGSTPPPGAALEVEGGGRFLVGFDGQSYATDLSEANRATVTWPEGRCDIQFDLAAERGMIDAIPVVCR